MTRVQSQANLISECFAFLEVTTITSPSAEREPKLPDLNNLPDMEAVGLAKMNRKEFVTMVKLAFRNWQANNATLRAAALAFFTILPLPSLLIIIVEIFALFYGQAQGIEQILQQITIVAGPTISDLIGQLLARTASPFTSILSTLVSVIFALAGAIGAFGVLQDTLNVIWEVKLPKGRSLKIRVRERIVSFLLVLIASIIVVAWSGLTTLLFNSISTALEQVIGILAPIGLGIAQVGLSFILAALLFAIIYKIVPDTEVNWRDVSLAAIITGAAFTILNYIFGWYLLTFPVTTVAGAAGALIILLLWLFVIGQIILFGAQFSKIYAEKFGSRTKKTKSKLTLGIKNEM